VYMQLGANVVRIIINGVYVNVSGALGIFILLVRKLQLIT
jgi:hypothetical protein